MKEDVGGEGVETKKKKTTLGSNFLLLLKKLCEALRAQVG